MGNSFLMLESPISAIELPGSRNTILCKKCGRGKRQQTKNLQVELLASGRLVFLSDANSILVDKVVKDEIQARPFYGLKFKDVNTQWKFGISGTMRPPPLLFQIVAQKSVRISEKNLEFEYCNCNAVRSISFEPLLIKVDFEELSLDVYSLKENPEVLIFSKSFGALLKSFQKDLEYSVVLSENEYNPKRLDRNSFIDWSDL